MTDQAAVSRPASTRGGLTRRLSEPGPVDRAEVDVDDVEFEGVLGVAIALRDNEWCQDAVDRAEVR
jgi:hypothetical protein